MYRVIIGFVVLKGEGGMWIGNTIGVVLLVLFLYYLVNCCFVA
jgi:hypothetical protein